ncbi:MAG TPA: 50S ribosomal protein L9 [Kiloniellales bacterium]|nr:50S ribosomal protein L9 [Kiloniellales bacterium]
MEVILLERIESLGQMGEVVRVRPGFARNFLLPKKKALRATKANLAYFETQRARLEAANLQRKSEAEKVAGKVDGLSVVVIRQAGESGQLYGSVTARDIAEAVDQSGVSVERQQIVLDRPIKSLGLHRLRVRLHPEVSVGITVNVARSAEEAETQAKTGQMVTRETQEAAEEAAIQAALAEVKAVEAEGAKADEAKAE